MGIDRRGLCGVSKMEKGEGKSGMNQEWKVEMVSRRTIGICSIRKQVQNTPTSAFPHSSSLFPRTSPAAPPSAWHSCILATSSA